MISTTLFIGLLLSLSDLTDPGFWKKLAPALGVPDATNAARQPLTYPPQYRVRPLHPNQERELYLDGFVDTTFTTNSGDKVPKPGTVRALARVVSALRARGIPPAFLLVYDQAWLLFSGDRLTDLLDPILGKDWVLLPRFWVWHVSRENNNTADKAGWPIHRDSRGTVNAVDVETGIPNSINIWMPLTPATPRTSCMYLLPMGDDPGVFDEKREYKVHNRDASILQIGFPLESLRAMPAWPGSILLWNHYVLHYGSKSVTDEPRISVAFEAKRKGFTMSYRDQELLREYCTEDDDGPLFRALREDPPRSLDRRLKLIARQLIIYSMRYPLTEEMEQFVNATLLPDCKERNHEIKDDL